MSARREPVACGVPDNVVADCVQSFFPEAELSRLPYLSFTLGLITTAMRQDPLLVLIGTSDFLVSVLRRVRVTCRWHAFV